MKYCDRPSQDIPIPQINGPLSVDALFEHVAEVYYLRIDKGFSIAGDIVDVFMGPDLWERMGDRLREREDFIQIAQRSDCLFGEVLKVHLRGITQAWLRSRNFPKNKCGILFITDFYESGPAHPEIHRILTNCS